MNNGGIELRYSYESTDHLPLLLLSSRRYRFTSRTTTTASTIVTAITVSHLKSLDKQQNLKTKRTTDHNKKHLTT